MKASELKKDDHFILIGRRWRLTVINTEYTHEITVKPDGTGAFLNERVLIAKNEHGMRMTIPLNAQVEKIIPTEIIPLYQPQATSEITEKKAANE